MWRLLIFSALVAVSWAQGTGGIFAGRLAESDPRLGITAVRIFALEKKIDVLKEKLKYAEEHDPQQFIHELETRVTHEEGTGCTDRHFQCGGHDRECISDLLVCDGHKDCANEHDEDDDICSTSPVKAGNVFVGSTTWTSCLTREDRITRIAITSTKRVKFFTARVRVSALIEADHTEGADHHTETDAYPAHGYYNFGTRRLILFPDSGDFAHIGVVCEFNKGDDERTECKLGLKASKHECAHALLHLKDH